MTTVHPDERPINGDRPHEGPAKEAFAVGMPRSLAVRLFGLNPLVRTTDRVEALILVMAFVVSVVALPVAAAVGTAVHESRSRLYAEQARHTVVATITEDSDARRNLSGSTATAPAQWVAAGTEHAGSPVVKPMPSARDEAVATALAIWFGAVIGAAVLFGLTRILIDRVRYAGWQRDFDRMVGVVRPAE